MGSALQSCPSPGLEETARPACFPGPETAPQPAPPHKLTFQWHITECCNLRCTHCYQNSYGGAELHFEQWLEVLRQLQELLDDWARTSVTPPRAHINLTGGEPFVHQDCLRLLEVFHARRDRLSFALLCNGSFIDERLAR